MNSFQGFTVPVWEIFVGNLLLLICSLFYLFWWGVTYRPNSIGPSGAGGLYLFIAFITGVAAAVVLGIGINSLSAVSDGLSVRFVLLGVGILFMVMLPITTIVFHRIVTSELLLIHLWTAVELSAVVVLKGSGRFDVTRATLMAILIGLATIAGLVCYVIYYRLDEAASYWNGMIPLISDALVMVVFLAAMVL